MSAFADRIDALDADTLVARGSLKWTAHPGTIGAWVAEMDFELAEPIVAALRQMHERYFYGYLPRTLPGELAEATASFNERRYGWRPDTAMIHGISDVLHGLGLMIDTLLEPDAPIVTLTPAYMPFVTIPAAHGRRLVQVPMIETDDGWELPLDALADALTPGSLLVLASPYNPVGKVFTRTELEAIAGLVERAGARVFADEIHAPLTFAGHQHVPYASVSDAAAAHSVTAQSASKAWNLAGLKCSQLIFTNPDDQAVWERRMERLATEPANPGVVANIAAYTHGGPWLDDALAYLDVNRRLVAAELPAAVPGAKVKPLQGTYLQLIDCRALDLGGVSPQAFFLERAKVALNDGATMGEAGVGMVRLNLATPTPILRELIARLGDAVASR